MNAHERLIALSNSIYIKSLKKLGRIFENKLMISRKWRKNNGKFFDKTVRLQTSSHE